MAELTRRDLFKAAGATAAVIGVAAVPRLASAQLRAAAQPPPGAWNHDPASPIGPLHWGTIGFPTCGTGTGQSPVNISTDQVAAYRGPPLPLRYQQAELGIENTGHVVEVPTPAGADDTLQIGGGIYQMVQYHFHAPSEHAVNGHLADLEAHFVHMNAQGVTAVVGVFFNIGPDPNPLLDTILLVAPETAGEEVTGGKSRPAELFWHVSGVSTAGRSPVRVNSFYSYTGSLTTPGCTEGVLWSVLAGAGQVSSAAVTRFHQLIVQFPYYDGYPDNNRRCSHSTGGSSSGAAAERMTDSRVPRYQSTLQLGEMIA
jgi:carbonic anhydrase